MPLRSPYSDSHRIAKTKLKATLITAASSTAPIPELNLKNPVSRKAAERVAQNTPMQGSGADILKLAMLATSRRLAAEGLPAAMLLTVHDELVFEVDPDRAEAIGVVVKEEMEHAYPLNVPLEVDLGIARSWADA